MMQASVSILSGRSRSMSATRDINPTQIMVYVCFRVPYPGRIMRDFLPSQEKVVHRTYRTNQADCVFVFEGSLEFCLRTKLRISFGPSLKKSGGELDDWPYKRMFK